MLKGYDFPKVTYRARCLPRKEGRNPVVDGDTVDLYVDLGFHSFKHERFRLYDIDTPELRDRDIEKRELAKEAKEALCKLLHTDSEHPWPLRVETFRNPDSFGRYLVIIYAWEMDGAGGKEINVNEKMIELGHAVRYIR